jgi:hypothetical protein
MVVAMIAMREMQVPVDEIAHVVTVRHGFVTAPRAVDMPCRVTATRMLRCALSRVLARNLDHVFVDVAVVHVVKVAIVEIIDMIAMADCRMATAGTMNVIVVGMLRM